MRLYNVVFTISFVLITSCNNNKTTIDDQENNCPQGLEYCSGICVAAGTCQAQTAGTSNATSGGGGTIQGPKGGTGQPAAGTGSTAGRGGASTQPTAGGSAAAGGSGAGGSGGSVPTTPLDTGDAKDLTCDGVSIPAADVISDFAQTKPVMYKTTSRGGTTWLSWAETTPATLSIDTANSGPCNSGGSLKIVAPGTNKESGEGIGIDFQPPDANKKKRTYDAAAAGYTGVGFWAKCTPERSFIYIKVLDAANDADVPTASGSAPCSYSSEPKCSQYGIKNVTITDNEWTYYKVYFSELLQDPKTGTTWGEMGGLDPSKVASFQFQINTPYDISGGSLVPTPSNCWVDDVHFIKDKAPEPQTTCATAYTVSGNKIMCGSTPKIFRGVARPSMEWDSAGWNITPWDMARIKGDWKANVVRYSLNQDYYMNKFPNIYPKYVARSVRWAEAAGMDVILDLHWVDDKHQSPTDNYMAGVDTNSPAFWAKVAAEYKSDPHVMFELYNEPTVKDWNTWKTNFQAMYDAVRGADANNIVIIGGIDWAYDLTGVATNKINGTNIVYNTHPYSNKPNQDFQTMFGYLAATYPLFATEFGTYDCSGSWTTSLIQYMEGLGMSWTAWAWYVAPTGNECAFPSIIKDYSGTMLPGGNAQAAKDGLAKNP